MAVGTAVIFVAEYEFVTVPPDEIVAAIAAIVPGTFAVHNPLQVLIVPGVAVSHT
jgi:hypothetical protein